MQHRSFGVASCLNHTFSESMRVEFIGDFPIVWANRNYRMVYLNMGHGDEEFIDPTQNLLLVNAFRWVVSTDKRGNPFQK